jgi:hypothetical protein
MKSKNKQPQADVNVVSATVNALKTKGKGNFNRKGAFVLLSVF